MPDLKIHFQGKPLTLVGCSLNQNQIAPDFRVISGSLEKLSYQILRIR